MALPPSIPTSFVPHPAASTARKSIGNVSSILGFIAYSVLAGVFVVALGVFFYQRLLLSAKANKDEKLAQASKGIDVKSVADLARLHDRLIAGSALLGSHVAVSQFFTALENSMPSTIRFSNIHLNLVDGSDPKLSAGGVAKNFNALAVASAAFATDSRIKGAIFSGIALNKDGTVNFSLEATVDQKVITYSLNTP